MKFMAFVFVALAAFVATSSATQYAFKAKYVLRDSIHFPNAYVNGTVYYLYDDSTPANSRVRYETTYKIGTKTYTTTDLYHYTNGAIYTICDECSAVLFASSPDMWWGLSTDSCKPMNDGNNWVQCTRSSLSTYGVTELQVIKQYNKYLKPGENGFNIRHVSFNDGRELELSGYEKISYDANRFELPKNHGCPEPECKSFADIVFVLDTSTSVSDSEWSKTKSFLKKAVAKFNYEEGGARVGVVEFNAPDKTCSGGWWSCCSDLPRSASISVRTFNGGSATRYIQDCLFDKKCNNKTDNTANVLFDLTNDRVIDKVNNLKRSSGHTCQRYGLQLAYKMLFENNTRCKDGLCPVPIVIVVTDGEDLCRVSTEEWARIIREADDRGYLLEVGVGLEAQYDVDFIANLSSTIGGNKASLSVDNFDEIDRALDTIIKPVCDIGDLGASCGPECKGFCVCGECTCPVCDGDGDSCNYFECNSLYPQNGCLAREISCNDPVIAATQCYEQKCDPSSQDPDNICKAVPLNCTEIMREKLNLKRCQYVECVNGTGGCENGNVINDDSFCAKKSYRKCMVGKCDPTADGADQDGCVAVKKDCSYLSAICEGDVYCNDKWNGSGECEATGTCDVNCVENGKPICEDKECMVTHCISDPNILPKENRCNYTPVVCNQQSENNCMEFACRQGKCIEVKADKLGCKLRNNKCFSYQCDPTADNGKGACVQTNNTHDSDNCTVWTCDPSRSPEWQSAPKCTTDLACKTARCKARDGGECELVDISCVGKINVTDCFQAICKEPKGCQKKLYDGAYVDICGECIRSDGLEGSATESQETGCIDAPEEPLDTEGLAAAAVALIIIGAVIIGAAVAASTVLGTKALLDRARGAANQSVVSNPLFEDSQTEMSNPAFAGDTV